MLLKVRSFKKNISFVKDIKVDKLLTKPIFHIVGGFFTLSLIFATSLYINNLPMEVEIETRTIVQEAKVNKINRINKTNKATLQLQDQNYPVTDKLLKDQRLAKEQDLTITVKNGDNLSKIFKRLKITQKTLLAIINADKKCKSLANLKPGEQIKYSIDPFTNRLTYLGYKLRFDKILHLRITEEERLKYNAEIEYLPIKKEIKYVEGSIKSSLFKSAKLLGLSKKTIIDLTNIFGWDIDFVLDTRPEDKFRILYEVFYHDGKFLKTGDILVAEFINKNKTFQAIKFQNAQGKLKYYTPRGESMERAFTRTPVKFSRISSHFSLKRRHPKLHIIRAHHGVDYAAPTGTPISATGDGKVLFIGRKGGYGKVVILQHGREYSTLYAHLSRFSKKLKKGTRIKQGQVIGYVGKTGLATASHLHYEFRINGIHYNPLTVKLPKSERISSTHKSKFFKHSKKMISMLNSRALNAE